MTIEPVHECPWCGEDMLPSPVHGDNPPDLTCVNGHEWWDDDAETGDHQ